MDVLIQTKPKSIFDIPKPVVVNEEKPVKKRRKRRLSQKKKKPKTARAGGVEVSQKTNVRGQKQITLKHKGGLTQEITINTGEQKPRGAKAKGKTASWNMKPAKFKASRGLRDNRVYLEPPKREYFGNRYKSAIDQIKINQKVAEAGASKNKEIADVKQTANAEKRELERRERASEGTINELKKEKAGIVASYNVSQRNQSRATILGGDVGELNKLINRRGYQSIRTLVVKGEITDDSTILQLDLPQRQIDSLLKLRGQEQSDYVAGKTYVYTTPKGIVKQGKFISETAKFVRLQKPDGSGFWKVPKDALVSGKELERVRSQSTDPAVRGGSALPRSVSVSRDVEFGSPRKKTESEERDVPEWTRSSAKRFDRRPATTGRKVAGGFKTAEQDFSESSSGEDRPKPKAKKPPRSKSVEAQAEVERSLSEAEAQHIRSILQPISSTQSYGARVAEPEPQPQPQPETEPSSSSDLGTAGEEEFSGREEALDLSATSVEADSPPPTSLPLTLSIVDEEAEARRAEFLEGGDAGGGSVRTTPNLSASALQSEVYKIEDGTSKYSTTELERLIGKVPSDDEDLPFLKSSFATLRPREEGAQQRKQRGKSRTPEQERELERLEEIAIESSPRPRAGGGETPREFFEGLAKPALSKTGQTPAVRKAAEAVRRGSRERSVERARASAERDEEGAEQPRRLRESTPPTTFFTAKDLTALGSQRGQIAIVDNRKDRKRSVAGTKRGVERPVKAYSLEGVSAVIRDTYGDTATGNALIRKMEVGARKDGNIYINDKKILNALGFRD